MKEPSNYSSKEVIKLFNPLEVNTVYIYYKNDNGNVLQEVSYKFDDYHSIDRFRNNFVKTYEYDSLNRISKMYHYSNFDFQSPQVYTYDYNSAGFLKTIYSKDQAKIIEYNIYESEDNLQNVTPNKENDTLRVNVYSYSKVKENSYLKLGEDTLETTTYYYSKSRLDSSLILKNDLSFKVHYKYNSSTGYLLSKEFKSDRKRDKYLVFSPDDCKHIYRYNEKGYLITEQIYTHKGNEWLTIIYETTKEISKPVAR